MPEWLGFRLMAPIVGCCFLSMAAWGQLLPPTAIVLTGALDLNGNTLLTDSYNSEDPAKSSSGTYDPTKYTGDSGNIICGQGLFDREGTFFANIYGKLSTGVDQSLNSLSWFEVGSHAWQDSNTGIQPGWLVHDPEFVIPDTALPDTSSGFLPLPPGGTVITHAFTYQTNVVTGSPTFPSPVTEWSAVSTNVSYSTNLVWMDTPGPVFTNMVVATNAVLSYPVPEGVITNAIQWTTNVLPNPVPADIITNTVESSTKAFPQPGTYLGEIITNIVTNGYLAGRGTWYIYQGITGYTYPMELYTFLQPAYTYASDSYNYSTFTTNTLYFTNVYSHILAANMKYVAGSLTGSTYLAGPNITLVLSNGLTGNEDFTWSLGAYLKLCLGGRFGAMGGNNYINPNLGDPRSFIIYCAPDVTDFTYSGNGQLSAIIVAPNARVVLNGAGTNQNDICGMIVAKSMTLVGHYAFHADESLSFLHKTPAATLINFVKPAGGSVRFQVSGVPGFAYVIEASTNFSEWLPVSTNLCDSNFTDFEADTSPSRFYRAVYLPDE